MDLAIALVQVVAGLAALATVGLAMIALRDARTERSEERDYRREERRERRHDQLQRVALLVEQILDTVPFKRTLDRDIYQRQLRIALGGLNWARLEHTRELASLDVATVPGAKYEEVGKKAREELARSGAP